VKPRRPDALGKRAGVVVRLRASMILHIMQGETGFGLESTRREADGMVDLRRVEMKRNSKRYSQVEPAAEHFHRVELRVHVRTGETGERLAKLQRQVRRLCPVSRLLEDAGVDFEPVWIRG